LKTGNHGASAGDDESARPYIEGLVVCEFSRVTGTWRSDAEARDFLANSGFPVVTNGVP
jgi:carbamoyl-phosphate synthase small subunit